MDDFDTSHLEGEALKVAKQIMHVLNARYANPPSGGGCKAFHDPKTWIPQFGRGGEAPKNAVLVVAHDGGDARCFFNYDYCDYESIEVMREALERIGYYSEQDTTWYSIVYPTSCPDCDGAGEPLRDRDSAELTRCGNCKGWF